MQTLATHYRPTLPRVGRRTDLLKNGTLLLKEVVVKYKCQSFTIAIMAGFVLLGFAPMVGAEDENEMSIEERIKKLERISEGFIATRRKRKGSRNCVRVSWPRGN